MVIRQSLSGVCAREVVVSINNGIVQGCSFTGGCDGQGKSINALVSGMPVKWVIERLSGLHCGVKTTSCAGELAKVIQRAVLCENKW